MILWMRDAARRGDGMMAYFKRNGILRPPANSTGPEGKAYRAAPETGRDRRKTTRLFKNWEAQQELDTIPAWRVRPRVSTGDLQDYCVCGCFAADNSDVTVDELGGIFRESLDSSSAGLDEDPYAAAVLLGIFAQLGASLPERPRPLFDEGKFPTPDFDVVLYRLVVLPFAQDSRSVDHWLALGSWRSATLSRMPFHAA